MLSVSSYPQPYVDGCRTKVDRQISAYQDLENVAKGPELEAFEPLFFSNMVMVLDNYFLHRSRTMELKDGNPLNEARVLCNSIRDNDGIMGADKTIKLDPATSVLGYAAGDEISLNVEGFQALSKAFFDEIERKYP